MPHLVPQSAPLTGIHHL